MSSIERLRRILESQPASLFGALVALAVGFISVVGSVKIASSQREQERQKLEAMHAIANEKQIEAGLSNLASLNNDVQTLKKALATLNDSQKASVQMQELSGQLELTNNRLKSLETALVDSPEKALSLPLMRRDISALQQSLEVQRTSAKAELERIYDFNKWFFGLFAALAVSIVGVAGTSVFKSRKEKAE